MTLLHAIVLGIIQGLSEFLPISSSGHLILAPWLFGWEEGGITFDVALHVGTAVAVLLYFWRDWGTLIGSVLRGIGNPIERKTFGWRLAWMIVIGSIPAAIIGFALESTVEALIRQPALVGILLMVFAVILWYADRVGRRSRPLDSFTIREALIVGLAQAVALAPGVSRSGVTLTAGLLLGLNREAAARFSFLLSMPVILGAAAYQFYKVMKVGGFHGQEALFLAGMLASAIVGIVAIRFLLTYLQRNSVLLFVVYRLAVGAGVVALALAGR